MAITPLKDNSKRERFLLMLFPAALILAVYSVVFAIPLRQEKSKIEAEYNTAMQTSVSEDAAQLSKRYLENEKESLERLRTRESNSKEQIRELSQSWRSRKSRLDTFEKITELMRDYNLSIVSQGGTESMTVSSYMRDLFEMMNEQAAQEPVEFWPVEVKGAFFDVLKFLTDVNTVAKSIIPVSITMKPDPENKTQKMWTIVFVI
ncbi:hypothetical protein N9B60_02300 [Mariniblastus sp.]|jgi:hypothetical protein|nr:hypothetical protein [Mariniblastus sp.]MDA7924206.1 hypothetical protein [Mariniblastus sp.]MDB4357348.1 hypothetical protein [Mariniblastus sp.]MDB4381002.1 hypothetical protein [Mariniblastus sp.]